MRFALVLLLALLPGMAAATAPDIVLVLLDDTGAGTFGPVRAPYGTPNLDRIAQDGVRYTHGYGAPVCVPARSELMSGRFAFRSGNIRNGPGLPGSAVTLAERLRDAGYDTRMLGKWHLGKMVGRRPLEQGFERLYGFRGAGAPYVGNDPVNPLYDQDVIVPNPGYLTTALVNRGVRWLEEERDRPLFLYAALTAPHPPFQARAQELALVPSGVPLDRRARAAAIIVADREVGRLWDAARPETLFIIVGDNGIGTPGLRGKKRTVYEGGIRVPLLVARKGHGEARTEALPAALVDLSATILEAAGVAQADTDGQSLLNAAPPVARPIVWVIDDQAAIRLGRWKLVRINGAAQLFDIESDPDEGSPVKSRPDLIASLGARLRSILSGGD